MSDPITPFDRSRLRRKRERAMAGAEAFAFLRDHAEAELADRLQDVNRKFSDVLLLGAAGGLADTLRERSGLVVQCDLARASGVSVVLDEEVLPFAPASFDLALAIMTLHWVNDLPGCLLQLRSILRPDGFFLGTMLGGSTLWQLRQVLLEAESELANGAAPRVSPFAGLKDMGALMQRAGFALPVVDGDTVTVMYDNLFALVRDLRGMGAASVLRGRALPLSRRTALRTAELYQSRFGENGRIPATFEFIHLAGWSPHSSQQKPLRPGSAKQRLSDALGTVEHKLQG